MRPFKVRRNPSQIHTIFSAASSAQALSLKHKTKTHNHISTFIKCVFSLRIPLLYQYRATPLGSTGSYDQNASLSGNFSPFARGKTNTVCQLLFMKHIRRHQTHERLSQQFQTLVEGTSSKCSKRLFKVFKSLNEKLHFSAITPKLLQQRLRKGKGLHSTYWITYSRKKS